MRALASLLALAPGLVLGALLRALPSTPARAEARAGERRGCPAEMVRVRGFCVDRFEVSTVHARSFEPLSPFYPPNARLVRWVHSTWQIERELYGVSAARQMPLPELPRAERDPAFDALAVARAGVVPQAYLSLFTARRVCENAGKRLCTQDEWVMACRGEHQTQFPYGASYRAGRCNVHRALHPAWVLHASSSLGLLDPRLNLVAEGSDPLLRPTGATATCASVWGEDRIFDMVGNLDEWVEDGLFLGGFYARPTTRGCDAQVSSHAASYFDYSTGTRCCRDAR